ILTTHVGSLIRPPELQGFLHAKQAGEPFDHAAHAACLAASVAGVVARQAAAGIHIVSDREVGKSVSWAPYALARLPGFAPPRRPSVGGANRVKRRAAGERFAEFYPELDARGGIAPTAESVCVAPIAYADPDELLRVIANFKSALGKVAVVEAFLPVAAPASVI